MTKQQFALEAVSIQQSAFSHFSNPERSEGSLRSSTVIAESITTFPQGYG